MAGRRRKVQASNDCGGVDCNACGGCFAKIEGKMVALTRTNELREQQMAGIKSEVEAWREKAERLTLERNELGNELANSSLKEKKRGSDRWGVRHLKGADAAAQEIINVVMKECVFPYEKFLPRGWEIYNRDSDSICCMIMDEVCVREGFSDEDYWYKMRDPATYKIGTLKQQARRKIMRALEGKTDVCN